MSNHERQAWNVIIIDALNLADRILEAGRSKEITPDVHQYAEAVARVLLNLAGQLRRDLIESGNPYR